MIPSNSPARTVAGSVGPWAAVQLILQLGPLFLSLTVGPGTPGFLSGSHWLRQQLLTFAGKRPARARRDLLVGPHTSLCSLIGISGFSALTWLITMFRSSQSQAMRRSQNDLSRPLPSLRTDPPQNATRTQTTTDHPGTRVAPAAPILPIYPSRDDLGGTEVSQALHSLAPHFDTN